MTSSEKNGSDTKPKIFIFANTSWEEHFEGLAVAEDGCILNHHLSSSEEHMKRDMGFFPGQDWSNKKESYLKKYPDGYELEYIAEHQIGSHEGLMNAKMQYIKRETESQPKIDLSLFPSGEE